MGYTRIEEVKMKSVLAIFSDSTITFRKSFWGLIATYWVAFLLLFAVSWVIGRYYALPWSPTEPWETLRLLPTMSYTAYVLFGLLLYFSSFVFSIWQVLVIKNNLFYDKSNLSSTFKEACLKTISVIFSSIILAIFFIPLLYLLVKMFHPYPKVLFVAILLFMPFFLIFYLGLILQEGRLKEVLSFSIRAALYGYLKTLCALVIFVIAEVLLMIICVVIFTILRMTILLLALSFFIILVSIPLMYVCLNCFAIVYFVETYYSVAIEYENRLEKIKINKNTPKATDTADAKDATEEDIFKDIRPLGEEPQPPQVKDTNEDKTIQK